MTWGIFPDWRECPHILDGHGHGQGFKLMGEVKPLGKEKPRGWYLSGVEGLACKDGDIVTPILWLYYQEKFISVPISEVGAESQIGNFNVF